MPDNAGTCQKKPGVEGSAHKWMLNVLLLFETFFWGGEGGIHECELNVLLLFETDLINYCQLMAITV